MSEEMNLDGMPLKELEALQVAKEFENREAMNLMATLELEDNRIAREIAEKSLKRKDLKDGIIKAQHNLRRVASELRVIRPAIYARLRGE